MPPPDDSPAGRIQAAGVELLTAVEAAAQRAAQQWDTDTETSPQETAHAVRSLADQAAAAILASAPKVSRNEPERPDTTTAVTAPTTPSRNAPAVAATRSLPASAHPTKASRDDPKTEPAPVATGIEPRPQKLAKKTAAAIVDAAELVRDPDHRDNHRSILRSGDTVLGYVEPTYGGASRSGRNGWTGRLSGHPGPRCRSRDGAAADLAMRWVQVVTAPPKRHITGND
jgi:hypothetical protein